MRKGATGKILAAHASCGSDQPESPDAGQAFLTVAPLTQTESGTLPAVSTTRRDTRDSASSTWRFGTGSRLQVPVLWDTPLVVIAPVAIRDSGLSRGEVRGATCGGGS